MEKKYWEHEKTRVKTALDKWVNRQVPPPKSESHLESIFCFQVRYAGGWPVKMNPIGNAGLPDRIVFFRGTTWLVELKTPKGTVSAVQDAVHRKFKMFGFKVRIVRTKEDIAAFITEMVDSI